VVATVVRVARHDLLPCVLLCACAANVVRPIPIAVLELGDRDAIGALHAADGLAPYEVALPAPPPQPIDDTTAAITRARTAYVHGELEACRSELVHVDIARLLADGDRVRASRALVFDAACAWGATAKRDAEADAERLASFGLELPDSAVAPDVETMIGTALERVGKEPTHALAIDGVAGARLIVDGRPGGCAVPCTKQLAPGEHVIAAEADGYAPAMQVVRVPDVTHVSIAQAPAAAVLAAQQWRARTGRGLPAADATGAALIGQFVPDRRVAVVHGGPHLEGELVVDSAHVAAMERARGETPDLLRELAYDGGVLHRPAVWQRPWFWIVVGGVAVVVAGAIVAATYQPPIHTTVGIGP
jgi:PEGA domain-containing protein